MLLATFIQRYSPLSSRLTALAIQSVCCYAHCYKRDVMQQLLNPLADSNALELLCAWYTTHEQNNDNVET